MLRSTTTATATTASRVLGTCYCQFMRIDLRPCTMIRPRTRGLHSTQLRRQISLPLTLSSTSNYIRPHAHNAQSTSNNENENESDFRLYPDFFNEEESRALSSMALWKLDRVNGIRKKKRRGHVTTTTTTTTTASEDDKDGDGDLQDLFNGEYTFEEGHYDSVIHNYRETLLSSLPPPPNPSLISALKRLYSLIPSSLISQDIDVNADQFPPRGTLTHLLHLSPDGEILPHVDNLDASGRVIVGVSLGSERILRLSPKSTSSGCGWDVLLTSGSVYVQSDTIRYGYEHSILPYSADGAQWDGRILKPGHRMSIMIRDAPSKPAEL